MPSTKRLLPLVAGLVLVLAIGCTSAGIPSLGPTATPRPSATDPFDNPTAGAIRRSTQQAATSQAPERLTQTAVAATRTAAFQQSAAIQTADALQGTQAAASATVAAKATGQSVLSAKAGWPQRVLEPFSDNHLGWPVGLTQDQYLAVTSTVADGRYHWLATIAASGAYTNGVPAKGLSQSDFYAVVTVQFVQGNDDGQSAYGIVFRQPDDKNFGFFGILKSGSFMMMEVQQNNVNQMVVDGSSAINTQPGATNRLGVAAIGPDVVCLVNDHVVGQMSVTLSSGPLGVGVEALTPAKTAQVDFSDFEVNAP